MKLTKLAMIAVGAGALLARCAYAQEPNAPDGGHFPNAKSVEIPFEDMKFSHTGYGANGPLKPGSTEPDIQISDLYGKFGSSRHSTMMKFPPNFKTVVHTHTGDYYAVLISGTLKNYRPGSPIVTISTPGSYWYQKAGEQHVTWCASNDPCVFFLTQGVGFDAQLFPDAKQ